MREKSRYKGSPFTLYWPNEIRDGFKQLVAEYDPFLTSSKAILKLMLYAIQQHWLPGYEARTKRQQTPIVDIQERPKSFEEKKVKLKPPV